MNTPSREAILGSIQHKLKWAKDWGSIHGDLLSAGLREKEAEAMIELLESHDLVFHCECHNDFRSFLAI